MTLQHNLLSTKIQGASWFVPEKEKLHVLMTSAISLSWLKLTHHVCFFQESAKWETGSPLGYQLFNNRNFNKMDFQHLEICHLFICSAYHEIIKLRKKMASALQPHFSKSQKCTLMVLPNLAEPVWIQIDCNINHDVSTLVCIEENKPTINLSWTSHDVVEQFCPPENFKNKHTCLELLWIKNISIHKLTQRTCLQNNLEHLLSVAKRMSRYFGPMSFPIVFPQNQSVFYELSYQRHLDVF